VKVMHRRSACVWCLRGVVLHACVRACVRAYNGGWGG
jgi:hypothetical protein